RRDARTAEIETVIGLADRSGNVVDPVFPDRGAKREADDAAPRQFDHIARNDAFDIFLGVGRLAFIPVEQKIVFLGRELAVVQARTEPVDDHVLTVADRRHTARAGESVIALHAAA